MKAMTESDWGRLKVLTLSMNWGEPYRISSELIFLLDEFFYANKLKPLITCGTQGKHLPDSQHYASDTEPGCAADIMFPGVPLGELPDIFLRALTYPFGGLGIYNKWKVSSDSEPIGGMHFDMRQLRAGEDRNNIRRNTATWIWTEIGEISLSYRNLKAYF